MKNSQCNVLALRVLKENRRILIEQFTRESAVVFSPMFEYENIDEQMKLAVEKHFIGWLNSHWDTFYSFSGEIPKVQIDEVEHQFAIIFSRLLQKFNDFIHENSNEIDGSLFSELIQEKINIIKEIIKFGEKSEGNLNKLRYAYQKDKTIFERQMRSLKDGEIK